MPAEGRPWPSEDDDDGHHHDDDDDDHDHDVLHIMFTVLIKCAPIKPP